MAKQIRPTQAYIDESRARVLLEKWGPVLDYSSDNVRAIEDDHTRLNTAILLENQEKWCFEASNIAGGTGGVFGSVNNGGFGTSSLPRMIMHTPQAMLVFRRSSSR